MNQRYEKYENEIEKHKQKILDAERHIWKNPETGYREWKTHAYMKAQFEALGYELVEAGNIPGFYTDIDTGIPGPKIAVFGEMDSLINFAHPECNPETGAVHSCGHHCQCAGLLGVAIALKAPGALDGLCGSIRLIAVPAEEGIEIEFRRELKKQGIIKYFSGKMEFLHRGYLDGVDISFMVHAGTNLEFSCPVGTNGNLLKKATFRGKAAHAGGKPHLGNNALYAAQTALTAANALRETFRDEDHIRFHPIFTKAGVAINAIPDEVVSESYVRGATIKAVREASEKVNRAYAAAAAAMQCTVYFEDQHQHAPRINDHNLRRIFTDVCLNFLPPEQVDFNKPHGAGCSDLGDICCVMPCVHPAAGGCYGVSHSANFGVEDPEFACVLSAKVQASVLCTLLSDDAAEAKKVLAEAEVPFKSKEEFFESIEEMSFEGEGVTYNEDGTVTLRYKA